MSMTIGSLFAGIGGFDLGFERAGFKTVWQCEIDKAAQGVLRRRFPDAALHADVRQVGAANLESVDVVTFGSPCQDLSVAGKRAGLAGERSGLFHEAARVIQELRERYGKPDFAIWENVPGAFSSNGGADFAAVVQAMVDLGARDVAWRVLDSRYFGVAQRRRRVFLVADFGGERAEQILFEPESLRGDFKKGGAKRKEAARGVGAGVASRGREWPADVSATLNAAFGTKMGLEDQHALNGASMFVPAQPVPFDTTQLTSPSNYSSPKPGDPCHPLAAGAHPPAVAFAQNTRDEVRLMGGDGSIVGALAAQPGMKQTTYVAQAQTFAFDGFQSAAPKAMVQFRVEETAPLISTRPHCVGAVAQPVAFQPGNLTRSAGSAPSADVFPTLKADHGRGLSDQFPHVAQPIAFHPTQDPISSEDGISHAMSSGNRQGCGTVAVAVGFDATGSTADAMVEQHPVLRGVKGGNASHHTGVAVCATGEVTHALKAEGADGSEDGTGRGTPITVHPPMQVRRLTPTECERLQGFPDGWTSEVRLPDGTLKAQADGPRYKQLGNAVTVNVAHWIARRVAATLQT